MEGRRGSWNALSVSPTPHSISTHLVQAAEQSRRKVHRFSTQQFVVRVGRTMATAAGRAPALLHPTPLSAGSLFLKNFVFIIESD
jgi:hypothetical protein